MQEASRAIRKKLKYGNVHRQLRALVILRSLTENAGKGFQLHWANQELVNRLKEMAQDVSPIPTRQTKAYRTVFARPKGEEEIGACLPRLVASVQGETTG